MNLPKLSRAAFEALFNFAGVSLPVAVAQPLPEWKQRSRANKPVKVDTPDGNRKHPGSILQPVHFKKPSLKGKARRSKTATQHERVVMSRAARLGISVKEYKVRYP